MGSAASKNSRKTHGGHELGLGAPSSHLVQPSPRPAMRVEKAASADLKKGRDVMISYSHQDHNVMQKLEGTLKANGISVWVDENALTPGAVFLREIGEAIVASKLFIVLLSNESVQSKYCQDEVSLAYISNKTIFAVSVLPYEDITEVMDLGMKLTLSCVQWTFIKNGSEEALKSFVSSIKTALNKLNEETLSEEKPNGHSANVDTKTDESTDDELPSSSVMNKQALNYRLQGSYDSTLLPNKVHDSTTSAEFWKLKFGNATTADWSQFVAALQEHMKSAWNQLSITDVTIKHLFTLLSKELNVVNGKLQYRNYMKFCTKGREVIALDEAINLFATAAVAVRGVFQIDSSVRLTAIENLGEHKSKAVINVLLDLLYDEEYDVRVVAAISLAHAASEIKSNRTRSEVVNGLLSCLNNDDRLVRESGCLALGRLKSKTAIKKLVYLWRNDYISTVREAAHIAIAQIGGDEAEQALHVTRVLGEEIQKLKA